jgi:uncharacterized repeat protein (TIGR01451 family)
MKKLLVFTIAPLLMSFVSTCAGAAYSPPLGGWNYIYNGDQTNPLPTVTYKPSSCLDGTWSANNGSSEWDGSWRGAGNGMPGGISSDGDALTIEDVNVGSGTGNNRKMYFTHDMAQDAGVTGAGTILDTGVTISFRTRLPTSDPLAEIALPDGWGIFSDGKANFNVHQYNGSVHSIVGFSLVRISEPDNTFNFTAAGLTMNRLNGNVPSGGGAVNSSGTAANNQVLPLDPTQWHEFWVTIQTNRTGGAGTHTVDIFMDGTITPTTFNVTAGTGNESTANYIAMGLNNSGGQGCFDIDFFSYRQGIFAPTPFTPPPAPTNLVAVAYDSQVRLFWAPAAGATGYNLLRAENSGGPYAVQASPTGTNYTDLAVVNDTTYYYVVVAVNAAGSSPRSAEVLATPKAAPSNVLAVGGTNQVNLTWTGLLNAESYTVKRATVSGGPYLDVATGVTVTEYLDTTVQAGRTYYYVVQARLTGGGLSAISFEASAVTAPSVPSLTAPLWAATVIQLKWAHANAVVTQFILQKSTDGVNFTDLAVVLAANQDYLDAGLNGSSTYFYRIQAQNGSGFSDYSAIASNTTPSGGWNVNFANAINGQPANNPAPTPPGYVQDVGNIFADRGNGYSYGWDRDITADGRWRQSGNSPDLRYDTFVHLIKATPPAIWEIEIPNGFYRVHIAAGDPANTDSIFQYNIEGVLTTTYTPVAGAWWGEFTNTCIVGDGRLTVTSGPNSQTTANNNKIAFIDIYPAIPVPVVLGTNPEPATVMQNRPVSFSVVIAGGSEPFFYQWYHGGVEVAGANGATLNIPLAQLSDEGDYSVVVTNYAGPTTSATARLTVIPDTDPPQIVSVGSVDGLKVGVCFDEILDTNAINPTAIDTANYYVNDGAVSVIGAVFRPDGRSVQLTLDPRITGSFSVRTENIQDLAGNGSGAIFTAAGEAFGFAQDLGFPLAAGSHYSCVSNVLELVGGGYDLGGNYDEGHFAYKTVTGDFDAKVRVDSLTLATLVGGGNIAKAGLMARSSIESNSPTLHLLANPPAPGRNQLEAGARTTVNGATASWGSTLTGVGTSNLWLRLTRAGDSFVGYWSSNGVTWGQFASNAQVMPTALLLGAAVSCHTNFAGLLVTGVFSGFAMTQPVADLALTKADAPDPVRLGSNLTYTITIANQGPDTATLTRVTDTLPAGVAFVLAGASQGACSHAAGVVTCNLGSLSASGSATVTIVVRTTAEGTAQNAASVTSNAVDPNLTNNTATTTTTVFGQPVVLVSSLVYSGADGGSFAGSFQTVAGITYAVDYKNTLDDATWTELTTIPGDGSVKPFTDRGPLPPTRFYRIRLVLP